MTGGQQREADRLRLCREAFERALADGVTVKEGRERVIRDRWAEADQRLQQRLCGTRVPEPGDQDGGRPLQWWQRD